MIAARFAVGLALAIGAAAAAAPASAQNCPDKIDLRDIMTVSAFDQAGLDKLSKAQLASLNAWLSNYIRSLCANPTTSASGGAAAVAVPKGSSPASQPPASAKGSPPHSATPAGGQPMATPAPAQASAAGAAAFGAPPQQRKVPNKIESRIIGEFHGWTGDTVFKLENGQVWKQAGPGFFETDLKNPKVTIKKLLIGYVLLVDGYAKEVFVRRIQ